MEKPQPKKNYRDSLFRRYFENPVDLAGLYKALTGEIVAPEDIKITTLKNVLFNNQKNDISFQVGNRYLILMEHQSTVNPNMPIRMLFYAAMLYRRMLPHRAVYKDKLLQLPEPEFYVLYNGEAPLENHELRLSTSFGSRGRSSSLELVAKVINIRYNENKEILKKYRPLHDYSYFVYDVERRYKKHGSLLEAIRHAVDYCIDHDVMTDFLLEHYEEVFGMYSFRWNEQEAKEVWQEEAREDARDDATVSYLKSLMKTMNLTAPQAMEALQIPASEYEKYLAMI